MSQFKQFSAVTSDFGSLITEVETGHDLFREQQRINAIDNRAKRKFIRQIKQDKQVGAR